MPKLAVDSTPKDCHTALPDEECYVNVNWAMTEGIRTHPDWYPGLSERSSFEEFQSHIHSQGEHNCPAPCPDCSSGNNTESTLPCLCVFDIDRTLTGKQGAVDQCPHDEIAHGIADRAYGNGDLTLSALATQGIGSTFCSKCYLGLCSTGDAGGEGSDERRYLLEKVLSPIIDKVPGSSRWSYWGDVSSPLALGVPNTQKQLAVEDIRRWYKSQNVCVARGEVYFFGDRTENIAPFAAMGFNSREVSCGSRDPHLYQGSGMVGLCGAAPEEIVEEKGNFLCEQGLTQSM
jgi:hypothetical protein